MAGMSVALWKRFGLSASRSPHAGWLRTGCVPGKARSKSATLAFGSASELVRASVKGERIVLISKSGNVTRKELSLCVQLSMNLEADGQLPRTLFWMDTVISSLFLSQTLLMLLLLLLVLQCLSKRLVCPAGG